jgi:hypothetical protein
LLEGLYVTPAENKVFDDLSNLIRTETQPGDRIVVFPQTPIFYLTGKRQIVGHAVVHWFDFLPDDLAIKEASAITSNHPALLIVMEMPESVWKAHEALFRGGKESGQREIIAAIRRLEASGAYADLATIGISPGYAFRVWKLK